MFVQNNDHMVAIANHEIFNYPPDRVINQSDWPSVWFSKIKRKHEQETEKHVTNHAFRLALVNCLNDIDEVNLDHLISTLIFICSFAKLAMFSSKSKTTQ